ncbi:flagellar motor switch protein FliN/FliY [Candidatus Kryptonium thompsonii]|uniref:Flagellar motor switch protein FliN n=1 Tax=Candidatus Kryptonium thompsonii TaxID=1633631 RepID=A0A0P1LEL5_9BACT|nr:flagellar motor switch protein FliN [Candidatus Kryptonium thompsoni]CUS77601.1 flagellar motor switch protein FliN/FliY [Candidatus Kryptonium thompsoni]CUS79672.1 flagellar motor switch protein FliN/FliY [Candidatus Kryptonium thompsoni]CUS82880.1 flagellar motor switch protein FliN/FliY [Candidatus Kryptonium thompsoni]CUS84523.1 flagellar motor switch protein FliN/FliY [Candidatus Kryptonium thompsoni]CUS90019.1 flagellar motor switch protein FliN/FliY [Candidatus Kryptonium thompsoni]
MEKEKATGQGEVKNAEFQNFEGLTTEQNSQTEKVINSKLELLFDVMLPVSIELGRTSMLIKDILELDRGSIIELDKLASEPVDVIVNGKKIAEGEVVVIDKHFGIRITNLIAVEERLKNVKR